MVHLLDIQSYWAYWYGIRKGCATDAEAWQAVEYDMQVMYGCGMYETIEAFRVGKHRYKSKLEDVITSTAKPPAHIMADNVTIPGYMERYSVYEEENYNEGEKTKAELWDEYEKMYRHSTGVRMYDNYGAFRQARMRYIQSIRKREHRIWKTKAKPQ